MIFIFTIFPAYPGLTSVCVVYCASVCFFSRQEVKPVFEFKQRIDKKQRLEGMFWEDKQNNRKIKFKAKILLRS